MSGLACGELSGPPSHGPEQREGKNRSQTTTNPILRPAHRFHLSRRDSVRRASPWLCHPGSDTEAEVGGQLGRGWGGEKCPSKGFEVGSVEWAREGRNLPPRLSGSGVEGSREGQLWPGRDWQEHEEDCSRGPIHCPGYSRGSRHLCAQKEPSYWGGDPEKTQASSGSQIDMHLRRKNGVSCVYRIWGDPGWS